MSEVKLTILDAHRAIHGNVHASDADRAIAALTVEPETIEELDTAMRRFTGNGGQSHFGHFRSDDLDSSGLDVPWDAGVVIIDLVAKLIAGGSTYSGITNSGSVDGPSREAGIDYQLSGEWQVSHGCDSWRDTAQHLRSEREKRPRIDARQVLYGRPLLEFIVREMGKARGLTGSSAVKKVHADWLLAVREDLAARAPRDVLLERRDLLARDLRSREFQWMMSGECPPGLDDESAAYKYAGFGMHEIVNYYDLVRHLLWECRERIEQEGELNRADEILRLGRLQEAWLASPNPDFHGRSPAGVINNERRRIPEVGADDEEGIDPDCPCCQMMTEDFGPYFWHLDGSQMDNEFAFSTYRSLEEWEEERLCWQEFDREFDEEQERRQQEGRPQEGRQHAGAEPCRPQSDNQGWGDQGCGETAGGATARGATARGAMGRVAMGWVAMGRVAMGRVAMGWGTVMGGGTARRLPACGSAPSSTTASLTSCRLPSWCRLPCSVSRR